MFPNWLRSLLFLLNKKKTEIGSKYFFFFNWGRFFFQLNNQLPALRFFNIWFDQTFLSPFEFFFVFFVFGILRKKKKKYKTNLKNFDFPPPPPPFAFVYLKVFFSKGESDDGMESKRLKNIREKFWIISTYEYDFDEKQTRERFLGECLLKGYWHYLTLTFLNLFYYFCLRANHARFSGLLPFYGF